MPDKSSLKEAWIIDPAFRFYQDPGHFCFNTDTVLLAGFVHPSPGDHVLEIGTNNAALLVWLDQFDVASLTGVEILPQAAAVARLNAEMFISHPCQIVEEDIRTFSQEQQDLAELVVCNPPYFPPEPSLPESRATLRQKGRIEYTLNLEELAASASRLLKSGGRLALVHRPQRTAEIFAALFKNRLTPSRLQFVYDRRDGQCKSVLIEAVLDRKPQMQAEPPLWIGEKTGA